MKNNIKQGKEKQLFLHRSMLNYVYGRRMYGAWADKFGSRSLEWTEHANIGFPGHPQPKYVHGLPAVVESTFARVVDHTGPCEMCGCRRNRLVCGKKARGRVKRNANQ